MIERGTGVVSVDDHVIEPPDLWEARLPARYRDVGPHVVRDNAELGFSVQRRGTEDGEPCDWWLYEDVQVPMYRLNAAAGFDVEDHTLAPITFDEMRRGCYEPTARLEDMDIGGIEASMSFPTFPRFCGQRFLEAKDKDLALLCVQAYNDWMVEEWCGATDRLIPLCIVPLWDPELAAEEIRRNADRGVPAVTFSENPAHLKLPSIHDRNRHWDPFLAACEETGTVVCLHIGSSSRMPLTSRDAPPAVFSTIEFVNPVGALADWLFSGVFERFPGLSVSLAEGQIRWIPHLLARADRVWEHQRAWAGVAEIVPEPPSTYFRKHVYGCFYDEPVDRWLVDQLGADRITFETDYPHSQTTWPGCAMVAKELTSGLEPHEVDMVLRTNALRMLGRSPAGTTLAGGTS